MDDTQTCPICGNKLRTINLDNKYIVVIGKQSNFVERTCTKGMNHSLRLISDKVTGKVDFINLSLNPKYSRYLEIDFINQKCRINCMKDGKPDYIDIPKMIIPDFPHLEKLKERVNLYVVFS